MKKTFRRHIELNSHTTDTHTIVRIALEDDIHHFRVELSHDDSYITDIQASSIRIPYSLCPNASPELNLLIGKELTGVAHSVHRMTDARLQCTHLLDLAGIAVAASARNEKSLKYEIKIPKRTNLKTTASLRRNNGLTLMWGINLLTIEGPDPFTGIDLKKGFAGWAIKSLPIDLSEAAIILRRAVTISLGAELNLDEIATMNSTGFCYAQQVERVGSGTRVIGSTKNFTKAPMLLCATDQNWLQFKE